VILISKRLKLLPNVAIEKYRTDRKGLLTEARALRGTGLAKGCGYKAAAITELAIKE